VHRRPSLHAPLRSFATPQRITETRGELAADSYRDVDARFRVANLAVRTLELGNKDLERYCKGLEKALLAFHATKMQAINQVRGGMGWEGRGRITSPLTMLLSLAHFHALEQRCCV